ncbi:hypothetical protein [Leptospira noguchii]|uniref:Uncharacterized protein n=1 Tax=Leptospira noguchii TaxID=28182 RepID=M6V928_9LEPT|nr:hypothetical protein [Leptospira noguchii]EMO53927.1 hypothetical protein LEP1GSC172_3313 [Leptospira noguchii]
MSFRNLIITAELGSPLCGEPPMLDSLLMYELTKRMGLAYKVSRSEPLEQVNVGGLPISKFKIGVNDFTYCVSNPIVPKPKSEWVEHLQKKFQSDDALLLSTSQRKSIMTTSGPYKARRAPEVIRNIESVKWFLYGDRHGVRNLLKKITSIGHKRSVGYGKVTEWRYDYVDFQADIFIKNDSGEKILMKTIPLEDAIKHNLTGFRKSFGGWKDPYWHPQNFRDIAIPC